MPAVPSLHYSGVLVVARPLRLGECIDALDGQDGVTLGVQDPERDRMVVVLEAPSQDRLDELHGKVRSLPAVVTADPIVHYVDQLSRDPVTGV